MRLAILLTRKSQLADFEGTIRAAAARGHEVLLILDTRLRGGPKADQAPDEASLPERFRPWLWKVREVRDRRFETFVSVQGEAIYDRADVVLYTYAPGFSLRRWGDRPVARLQGDWSTLMMLSPQEVGSLTRVYGWTDQWVRWWAEWNGTDPALLQERFRAVGMPVAEQTKWIDPAEVCRTFDWPVGQRALLYLPFPAQTLSWAWWTHGVYNRPWPLLATERAVVRRIRRWCDLQGLALVVKDRAKAPAPEWLRERADRIIGDEPWEPTTLRLLLSGQAAGLVHHLSTGCADAAVAGVWADCVAPWPQSRIPPYAKRLGMKDFSLLGPSFYDWPGLSRARTPAETVRSLACGPAPVDAACRHLYLERFLGPEPFDTGRRIVEDLEQATLRPYPDTHVLPQWPRRRPP